MYGKEITSMAKLSELSLSNETHNLNYENILNEGINEKTLSLNTLFQETKKIYGHYFDITDISVSKNFIISCNKSSTKKYSRIFIWNKNFDSVGYLESHDLGIQRLKFNKDGSYIVACSRDKKLSLFRLLDNAYILINEFIEHTRIIWDCAISFKTNFIASVSRDKKLFIYNILDFKKTFEYEFLTEPTSVSFANQSNNIVIGTLNGFVYLFVFNNNSWMLQKEIRLHSGAIKSVIFNDDDSLLITSGCDKMIRFYEFA
ncbi:Elongator subunit elp2 [Conglomerata obtusa]